MIAAKKTTARTGTTKETELQNIPPEDRARMIAEAAYYRAEHRGFQVGSLENDWFEAEKEVEVILSRPPQKAPKKS